MDAGERPQRRFRRRSKVEEDESVDDGVLVKPPLSPHPYSAIFRPALVHVTNINDTKSPGMVYILIVFHILHLGSNSQKSMEEQRLIWCIVGRHQGGQRANGQAATPREWNQKDQKD
ncbi:hypothetical protein EYF80_061893 [Liparis tanakae]|uniref:Uncharacterized protein n=1 Tax=Liparis tanakae TaxID=230148 RepID=A0A4Z2EGE2_9TELE|nr:hypothetical protein EYF80_061893 [Liparis tanakae]